MADLEFRRDLFRGTARDYDRFAQTLLAERKALGLPPYAHLALLAAEARREASSIATCT